MASQSVLTAIVAALLAAAAGIGAGPASAPAADDPALRDYLSANGLLNRGLNELAGKEYRKFLAAHPDHPRAPLAKYGLGVSLFREQRFDAAAAELKPLAEVEGFEFAVDVQAMLAQCALSQRQYLEAAEHFESALKLQPNGSLRGALDAGLVESLYRAGKFEASLKAAREAPAAAKDRSRIALFVGLDQVGLHDDAAAALTFESIINSGGGADAIERARLLLAQCCMRLRQPKKAAGLFREILSRADSPVAGEARAGLAAALLDSGDAEAALRLYDDLLAKGEQGGDNKLIRLQRGQALFALKDFRRALRQFEEIVDSGSEVSPAGAYWAAKCLLRLDRSADAAEKLRAAIHDHPSSELLPEMSYDLGVALARAGRPEDSVSALARFREQFPSHDLAGPALRLIAELQHQQRHYEQSLKACRALLAAKTATPDRSGIEFLFAENQFLMGDMPAAADAFARFLQAHADDPAAAKARYRLGVALFRLGKLDEAQAALDSIANPEVKDAALRPALLILADIAYQRGEWERAEKQLMKFLAGDPAAEGADQALLTLGLARARQGQWKGAVEAFDELMARFEKSPHRLQAEFERGQALLELGDDRAAQTAFEHVVAADGSARFAPYARNHLAAIAARRGDSRRAAELFSEVAAGSGDATVRGEAVLRQAQSLSAAGRDADAESVLSKFIKESSGDARAPVARARLAIAIARQNRCDDALRQLDAALAAGAAQLGIALSDALQYEKAWCLRSLGRNQDALAAYRPLIERGQGSLALSAALETAEIESAADRPEQALKLLRGLADRMDSDPDHVSTQVREQVLYRTAVCEYQLKKMDEAAKRFGDFVSKYPKSELLSSATYFAGECSFQAGRHSDAFRYLARVVSASPNSEEAKPALLRLGEAAAALQRWPESADAFKKWLDRYGSDDAWFQARFGLGWALENQGHHRRAIAEYRKVTESHEGPTAARAQFQIGECLFALKQYDDAAGELLKVDILYAYPEWSAAGLYEAGRCFEELGRTADARAQFRAVTEKHRQTRWAAMAAARLKELAIGAPPGR